MICDRCHVTEATVHVTRKSATGVTVTRHFCEPCADQVGLSDETGKSHLLFPWEEHGEGSFSFAGQIADIRDNIVVLKTIRCSHYQTGSEFAIPIDIVPNSMRQVGAKFSFNFPADRIAAILIDPDA